MKIKHLFFMSTMAILYIILVIQTIQMNTLKNALNMIQKNYSDLTTNLNNNLSNLNTNLTSLNSNITNLNNSQKRTAPKKIHRSQAVFFQEDPSVADQPIPLASTARIKECRSQPLFVIEVPNNDMGLSDSETSQ